MEENSEDCELQYTDTKSRSRSDNASTLPRPGNGASNRGQLMSDSSMVNSDSFEDQTSERVSIELKFKEAWLGKTDQERGTESRVMFAEQRYFSICNSCFWCASYFKNHISFTSCPSCYEGKIDCMPIGEDENYAVNLSLTKRVESEFSDDIQVLRDQ